MPPTIRLLLTMRWPRIRIGSLCRQSSKDVIICQIKTVFQGLQNKVNEAKEAAMEGARHSHTQPNFQHRVAALTTLLKQKQTAIVAQNWDLAKELRDREAQLKLELSQQEQQEAAGELISNPIVTRADIVEAVALLTDNPIDEV